MYAVSHLKGTAQRWYEPNLSLDEDDLPDHTLSWDGFEEALKTTFGEPDPESHTRVVTRRTPAVPPQVAVDPALLVGDGTQTDVGLGLTSTLPAPPSPQTSSKCETQRTHQGLNYA
jgi:hypothetical protein